MSSATSELPAGVTRKPKTYAVGHKPRSFGVWKFGAVGTAILAIGSLIVIVTTAISSTTAIVMALVLALALATTVVRDKHGASVLDRAAKRFGHRRQVQRTGNRKEGAIYQPGVLTHLGSQKLPGVLAGSKLHEYETSAGDRFTILEYVNPSMFVVVVECDPDGAGLVSDEDTEEQVDRYGDWLSKLAYEEGFLQLAITVETAPDGGAGLRREIDTHASDRAADLSKSVMASIANRFPESASASRAWAAFTFRAPKLKQLPDGTKPKSAAEVIAQTLMTRLPHLLEDFPETGAGAVQPLTAQELIEVVRSAYNPQDRKMFDQVRANGLQMPVLDWDHAGPTASRTVMDRYHHSGCTSITWEMTGFTTNRVVPRAFVPLFEGHPDVLVSRTTFLYHPIDPARSAVLAENDFKSAHGRMINAKRATAADIKRVDDADGARTEEAHGSALTNFAILHTATVDGVDDRAVQAAQAAVDRLGPTARLRLRRMDGVQDSAFAAAFAPLGLVVGQHLAIPSSVKNGL